MAEGNQQDAPPQRLASVLSTSTQVTAKETTLGGVQKTKFAPVVGVRRAKKEPEATEAPVDETKDKKLGRGERGARGRGPSASGRGRGRGGIGLLSDRRDATPIIVSGPFSLGPSALKSSTRAASGPSIGFAPSSSRSNGPGFKRNTIQSSSSSSLTSAFSNESIAVGLEDLIKNESGTLGEDNCPVHISACLAKDTSSAMEIDVRPSDILTSHEQIFLFQLPTLLPEINQPDNNIAVDEESEAEKKTELTEGVEGEFGELCIHESGRLSLLINGLRYFLDLGNNPLDIHRVAGAQSVVAIDPEYEQSFELGQINNSFIGSLHIDSLL